MLPRNHPDRIHVAFDDRRLVNNAGLILLATLALHSGLPELVDRHLDLGDASGRANTGAKIMTLVASALAGGDCIDDADALRTGGTAGALGCVVKAPSTLGTFLRSFRWGHVRQLDRVSRELLAQAWATDAGPGDGPLTIDLDSTICETYGLAKEGARHHGYTGQRGYHPLLAIAAGTGDVLMARLREGRANTARGAAHFLRETVGRCATAGPAGSSPCAPTAASTPTPWCPPAERRMSATPSPSASTRACAARSTPYPRRTGRPSPIGWRAPPLWPRPPTLPSGLSPSPRRCGSSSGGCNRRPVPNWPSSPATAITLSSPTGTEIPWHLEADHRRHAEIENAIRDLKYGVGLNHLPSGRFPANAAWRAIQSLPRTRCGVMAHNLARWTTRVGLGEQLATTKTLRRRFFALAGRLTRSARRLTLHLPQGWPWQNQFSSALARLRALPLPS